MPEIVISPGETEQIIEGDQSADRYLCRVSSANVRVAHQESLADRGTLIRAGDRTRLTNLRDEPLFAYNDGSSDARVDIDRAGVDVAYFPRATVTTIDSIDRVEAIGNIETTVDVTGSVNVQESTPLDVSAATVTTAETNKSPITNSTTANGASNAAQLDLATRTLAEVYYDVSGAATITVEVSTDGATWREHQTYSAGSAETGFLSVETGYQHVRAYADTATNTVEIASKGV